MGFINNATFNDVENILKRMIEQFQDKERNGDVASIYKQLNSFQQVKNEIDEYENEIKSRTRPLRLGFVGGFSTGKSSMINSLLGEEILGVKLEPATAQITELSYGEKFEIIEVNVVEDHFSYEDLSLKEYQKRSIDRANKNKNLSHYIIRYPSKNLSRFTLVDTPGFSSNSKVDDELTKHWIKSLDLLIWIFDVNKVGDKEEYNKLKELGGSTKVFGVINKIDLKSPSVREKIKNEILNDKLLSDVFFYSSKKVLDEYSKNTIFDNVLGDITAQIIDGLRDSEDFHIIKTNLEIVINTGTTTKQIRLTPPQRTAYTEYYDELINKINDVRDHEINFILNKKLFAKHNNFKNRIREKFIEYRKDFIEVVKEYNRQSKMSSDLLLKSELIFNGYEKGFIERLDASFHVFCKSFFDRLGDILFRRFVDKGIFSDDLYIIMKDLSDDKVRNKIFQFISTEFEAFLDSSFNIYDSIIKNSIYKKYSQIELFRNREHPLIHLLIEGLVSNSMDALTGYHRIFKLYKTDAYLDSIQFHKSNIDLVIPDEVLKNSIYSLLMFDLIEARYLGYEHDVEIEMVEQIFWKNNAEEILEMIDKLLNKLN